MGCISQNRVYIEEAWNLYNEKKNRTTNICETFNKKMNGAIAKPHPNIYKIIDIIKEHEQLAAISFEKEQKIQEELKN